MFLFQFPLPFPEFTNPPSQSTGDQQAMESSTGVKPVDKGKKVTFAPDVKAASSSGASTPTPTADAVPQKINGVIGQLEIHKSGAVKMRLENGMLFDVCFTHCAFVIRLWLSAYSR